MCLSHAAHLHIQSIIRGYGSPFEAKGETIINNSGANGENNASWRRDFEMSLQPSSGLLMWRVSTVNEEEWTEDH